MRSGSPGSHSRWSCHGSALVEVGQDFWDVYVSPPDSELRAVVDGVVVGGVVVDVIPPDCVMLGVGVNGHPPQICARGLGDGYPC